MTEKNQIYKCEICGNIVEILHEGAGNLVCCNQPMNLQTEKNKEEGKEKHIPIIKKSKEIIVGSIEHPMEQKHYIEWIEIIEKNNKVIKKFLSSTNKPIMKINQSQVVNIKKIRTYCNIHGLWINQLTN